MNLTELEGLETLNVSIEDKIAHIQLCRPKQFNTMNAAFWRELPRVVKAIDREAAARIQAVLGQLEAAANWHRIAREWMYEEEPATELGRAEAEYLADR